jgi:hypothetical protein
MRFGLDSHFPRVIPLSRSKMRTLRPALLLAASLLAPPARGASFDEVAVSARRLDGLEPFLSKYVGRCTDPYERPTCERHVTLERRNVNGRSFVVRVQDAAGIVKPSVEGDRFTLLLTPFLDGGGGYALTRGAPTRQDGAGRPLLALVPIHGRLPPGMMEMEFHGPFRTGAIELEIVFAPEKAWRLKRKGEPGDLEGVAARFVAVRVLDARSGREIASRVF